MMKIDKEGNLFYAPDSFDRSTMDCCYTTAGASPCLGEIAIDAVSNIDSVAYKPYVKGSVGLLNNDATFEVCTKADNAATVSVIDELRDRICALENAAVQVKETSTRPLKHWRWKRADYKTLV